MRIKFTNTDSDGNVATDTLAVSYEGERYEISPSSKGTANVRREIGEYLVESDNYAVESVEDTDREEEEPVEQADPELVEEEETVEQPVSDEQSEMEEP